MLRPLHGAFNADIGLWLPQVLFGVERKLDEAFQQLLGGHSRKVLVNQFLSVQARDVAELAGIDAGGVDEVAVPVVDDDDVALGVEPRNRHSARPKP